jgi:hypothetical protein
MCPQWTLMFPSYLLMMLGVLGFFAAAWDSMLAARGLDAPLFGLATIAVIVGFQLLQFGWFAKAQAGALGVTPPELGAERDRQAFSLPRGSLLSLISIAVGAVFIVMGLNRRSAFELNPLLDPEILCLAAPGVTMIALGVQLLAGELMVGLLQFANSPATRDEPAVRPPRKRRSNTGRVVSPWQALNRQRHRRSPEAVRTSNSISRGAEPVGKDAQPSFSRAVD